MGAVSIMKAIKDFDLQADKIILECPFGTMRKTTNKRFQAMGIPSFPFSDLLLFYGGIQNGFNPYSHQPIGYAKAIKTPCLLLYGEQDKRVTRQEIDSIFENLKGVKTLKTFPNSGHENYLNHSSVGWKSSISSYLKE